MRLLTAEIQSIHWWPRINGFIRAPATTLLGQRSHVVHERQRRSWIITSCGDPSNHTKCVIGARTRVNHRVRRREPAPRRQPARGARGPTCVPAVRHHAHVHRTRHHRGHRADSRRGDRAPRSPREARVHLVRGGARARADGRQGRRERQDRPRARGDAARRDPHIMELRFEEHIELAFTRNARRRGKRFRRSRMVLRQVLDRMCREVAILHSHLRVDVSGRRASDALPRSVRRGGRSCDIANARRKFVEPT